MMSSSEKNRVHVHVHVPKCAGSYVRKASWQVIRALANAESGAAQQVRPARVSVCDEHSKFTGVVVEGLQYAPIPRVYFDVNEYNVPIEAVEVLIKVGIFRPITVCLTSRMLSAQLESPLTLLDCLGIRQRSFFTITRPPFERMLSMYYVHKQASNRLACFRLEPHMSSIDEFSDYLVGSQGEPDWCAKFFDYVFGGLDAHKHGLLDVAAMEDVGKLLVKIYSDTYGEEIGSTVRLPNKVNVGSGRVKYSESDLHPNIAASFKQLYSRDIKLHNAWTSAS